jgi:hypothetical protein
MATVTLSTIASLKAAERAAKDAFWAAAGSPGSVMTTEQKLLQKALHAATAARQQAMAQYAASLI